MSSDLETLETPVEEVRDELLNDPDTANIAKKLCMPLEEYVEQVLYYAQNPDIEPEFDLIPEEEVKSYGGSTIEEVKQWFIDVQEGKIDLRLPHEKDAFEEAKKNPIIIPSIY